VSVDPEVRLLLDQVEQLGRPSLSEMSPEEAREVVAAAWVARPPGAAVARIEDVAIEFASGSVAGRIYYPVTDPPAAGLPVLVWLHGGGWVVGSIEGADPTARELAVGSGVAVLSVEYPLAPEHPFPEALDCCHGVLRWLTTSADRHGLDPTRIAVGGDSAGGNLAAAVALLARDRNDVDIAFQLLVYPATDLTLAHPSVHENGDGYLLTENVLRWCTAHYVSGGTPRTNPYVSPLHAADLSALPPALVITAQFDPLRDEGEEYAQRMANAGVRVTLRRYPGQIHTFFELTTILSGARDAMYEATAALRAALG